MFLNAVMLAGISAAVLPIVLHLLSRARYRRVEWGAMMFLEDTETRQVDRSRLAQYLLLLLRILAIATIATAFARPISRHAFGPSDGQRLAAAIVIDASPSMTHPEQSATRLDLARRAALGILGHLRRGDQVALVVLGRPGDRDSGLTTDLQDVASKLASLESAMSGADQADGVRRAEALLDVAGDVPREIYLVGDRQQSAWKNIESLEDRSKKRTRVIAVPVGSTENANAWIDSIHLTGAPAIAGQQAEIELRIRNGGSVARSDLPVTITLDDKELDATRVYVAPGATEVVRRPITLGKPGSVVVKATSGASGMTSDDTALLAIDVSEPIRVTVISGESKSQLATSPAKDYSGESDYLRLALTPILTGKKRGDDPFKFRVLSVEEWPELETKKDRVVVLSDVGSIDAPRLRALEQFVFAGGGLLLAPGAKSDLKAWNDQLFRDGQGLAPAGIESVKSAGDEVVRLIGISTAHEIFGFYAGRPDPLPPVSVIRWTKLLPQSSAGVLASLQSGDPLLVQKSFGRGRVAAIAIPLDADWSNFAYSNLYLPTMQSLVRWLGSAGVAYRNVAPGAAIEHTFESPRERIATVTRPDGRSDRVPMSSSGGSGTVIYPDADVPGRYTLRAPGSPAADFIVRSSGDESQLDLLDDDQLRPLADPAGITLVDPDKLAEAVGQSRRSTELSLGLLALGLALLGVELMLAQRSIPPAEVTN